MIGTPQEMRALGRDLAASVWTLAAIGALFESGLAAELAQPRSLDELAARCPSLTRGQIDRALAVVASAGVVVAEEGRYRLAEGAAMFREPPMSAILKGDLRTQLMQALAFLDASGKKESTVGWRHTDPALLQSQGDASSAVVPALKMQIVPMLGDLGERLAKPGARFLDVGVGVASIAIAMCRAWPELSVVGLDVYDVPLRIARANVARAALDSRIELRQTAIEALRDEAAFDFAWLPGVFIAESVLPAAIARTHAALREGGFIAMPALPVSDSGRQESVLALVNETWGGAVLSKSETEALLTKAGFASVRALPGPIPIVVGCRGS